MVRRKQPVKPVIAKPLDDTTKRNLVTSFVTNDIKESATNIVTNDNLEDAAKEVTKNVANSVTQSDTNIVINSDTSNLTNEITQKVTSKLTKKDTDDVTKIETKKVTKNVITTKRITLGKKEIVADFTTTKRFRPNYNLSEDTIEKIEKISDILGYKKAEFVDIYLNGTLTKVLKDLEKSHK